MHGIHGVYAGTHRHCCLSKALSITEWPVLSRSSLTFGLGEAEGKLILDNRAVAETAGRPVLHHRCPLLQLLALPVECGASGAEHSRNLPAQV